MYEGKPEVCPHCGAKLRKEKTQGSDANKQGKAKKEKTKQKKHISSQEIMDSLDFVELRERANKSKKKSKVKAPEFRVEKNGEYAVNIKDVTYLPETYTYSAKKARGDYSAPKIKWWEIYKWADLLMARRKIKKQVKNASYYKPEQFSKTKLILLALFLGWTGAHNFYARNYRKATFMLCCSIIGTFISLAPFQFLSYIRVSIGGGLLFIMLMMWVFDCINIISGTFSFRLSKWKFIDCLNTDCRATLGEKYIDKDEYKKPWYVKLANKISARHRENAEKRKLNKQSSNKKDSVDCEDENLSKNEQSADEEKTADDITTENT